MDDYGELERLFADGYLILGLHQLSALDATKKMDPANRDKYLVRFNRSDPREMLISDPRAIELAYKQLQYQNEPIGTVIHIWCAALGGSDSTYQGFCLDVLVPSLDGIMGWKLALGEASGTFEGEIHLQSTDSKTSREVLREFENLLDCLAVILKVGFHIQYYSILPIPRSKLPSIVAFGSWNTRLKPVVRKDIETLQAVLSNSKASAAARGLRQAYCESLPDSRLWRMWAAAEDTFGTKPEPLLTKQEAKALMACAEGVEGLKGDSDRLKKLKECLRTLPRVSRNEQIADEIASIMVISGEEADKKVKRASNIRGQHSHRILADVDGVKDSERFLHEALRSFLDCSIKSGND